ncbi:hypothetical protein ARMA_1096 [Ardenticatena maritima]|uniref:Uncharacterized protein n=1 Tax=Ardenticatena maritima TaxID=872965 RepID=A0A0M8K834_9CHLR|nr:hypothetical protein ARMA_1096 [Ardenticatena maritima]
MNGPTWGPSASRHFSPLDFLTNSYFRLSTTKIPRVGSTADFTPAVFKRLPRGIPDSLCAAPMRCSLSLRFL